MTTPPAMDITPFPPAISTYIDHILPSTEGWCSPEKAASLARHVLTHRPTTCVEIGVFAGRSLFAIALALRHNGHGHVLGIDPWSPDASITGFEHDPPNRDWWRRCDHGHIYREFVRRTDALDLTDWIDTFTGTSQQALAMLHIVRDRYAPRPIQLLHIDGNHSEAQALFDVENYVPLVSSGGHIYLDDTDWSTTKAAQDRLAQFADPIDMVGACGIYRVPEGGDSP